MRNVHNDEIRNYSSAEFRLKRIELCDMLLACDSAYQLSGGAVKWQILHDQIKEMLNDLDAYLDAENEWEQMMEVN